MKRTLGEAKDAACLECGTVFQKVRYDQRFCCKTHARAFRNREAWLSGKYRAKQNAARKLRYQQNKGTTLAAQRDRRKANPEEARAKDRARYERNKAAHIARCAKYRASHPAVRAGEYQRSRAKCPWRACLSHARNRSLKKNLAFDLTREWCEQRWTGRCELTGIPFQMGLRCHYPLAPSMDRIDSSKGYTQDNCRFILFAVNSFKGVGTDALMLEIAQALLERRPG